MTVADMAAGQQAQAFRSLGLHSLGERARPAGGFAEPLLQRALDHGGGNGDQPANERNLPRPFASAL
jgi:hypothetical protein